MTTEPEDRFSLRQLYLPSAILVVLAVIAAPLIFGWCRYSDVPKGFDAGNYGEWLSGCLIPGVVALSLFSLHEQRIANMTLIQTDLIKSLDFCQGHLNYLCYRVVVGSREDMSRTEKHLEFVGKVLRAFQERSTDQSFCKNASSREFLLAMKREVLELVAVYRKARCDEYLDQRVKDLAATINWLDQSTLWQR